MRGTCAAYRDAGVLEDERDGLMVNYGLSGVSRGSRSPPALLRFSTSRLRRPVFEPFGENEDLHFSVFGVLNATADTQIVRVTPVRENVNLAVEALDAVATLEHLGTGGIIDFQDSLVRSDGLKTGRALPTHGPDAPRECRPGPSRSLRA